MPTTCITGVDLGMTLTLMSESGGKWPDAWAASGAVQPVQASASSRTREFMPLNYDAANELARTRLQSLPVPDNRQQLVAAGQYRNVSPPSCSTYPPLFVANSVSVENVGPPCGVGQFRYSSTTRPSCV